MSHAKDREDFIAKMKREGMPGDVARAIMRDATTLQRIAEVQCSVEMSERESTRIEAQEEHCKRRILARCKPYGVYPVFQGDPRGACVKLRVPSGRTDDWGRTGICVPTRISRPVRY